MKNDFKEDEILHLIDLVELNIKQIPNKTLLSIEDKEYLLIQNQTLIKKLECLLNE